MSVGQVELRDEEFALQAGRARFRARALFRGAETSGAACFMGCPSGYLLDDDGSIRQVYPSLHTGPHPARRLLRTRVAPPHEAAAAA